MTVTDSFGKYLYNLGSNVTITIQPSSPADIDRLSAPPPGLPQARLQQGCELQAAPLVCIQAHALAATRELAPLFAVVYGIVDPWTLGSGMYNFMDFDTVYNAYETVTPGPCSGVGCCGSTSLTTLMHSPSPYSCYLPYYNQPSEFNITVRPDRVICPEPWLCFHLACAFVEG